MVCGRGGMWAGWYVGGGMWGVVCGGGGGVTVITSFTAGGGKYPEITSKEYILSKFYITAIEKE